VTLPDCASVLLSPLGWRPSEVKWIRCINRRNRPPRHGGILEEDQCSARSTASSMRPFARRVRKFLAKEVVDELSDWESRVSRRSPTGVGWENWESLAFRSMNASAVVGRAASSFNAVLTEETLPRPSRPGWAAGAHGYRAPLPHPATAPKSKRSVGCRGLPPESSLPPSRGPSREPVQTSPHPHSGSTRR